MKRVKRIKAVIITICIVAVIIGLVKVNIINTRALSPLGNSEENYERIKESFGDDFSSFINDNSEVKIYIDDEKDNILIRIGKENYIIKKESYLINILNNAKESVKDIISEAYNMFME
ncbi:MAG: hypothetical protein K5986_10320 [Clostridium sp.]|uniref:hypothetical protein n=1 Tax=Clostridium sp. DSM 8431 TaxID=1761781 RepID=UPI0008E4A5E6|nr:hypothetical protein [Clostridium sp. DSM 8431]MCR4944817.1 hypothetical protein [Clostridium sp.]SFU67250.1 hypothetical protein SAMN04487886_10964 [Clostridium sp. DSM 8431]